MGFTTTGPRRFALALAVAGALAATIGATPSNNDNKKKPSVSLKSTPSVGFAPFRVVVTADLRGGDDDNEQLYCPQVEWIWGDDTKHQAQQDCDPYEAGKSTIKRRYTMDHTYHTPNVYQVEFYLKQKDKRVLGGKTTVNVRPGIRDIGN